MLSVEEINKAIPDKNDVVGIRYYHYLSMQHFPHNMDEIEEKLFGKNKELVKK